MSTCNTGNSRGTCTGPTNVGASCTSDADCPGAGNRCVTGSSAGAPDDPGCSLDVTFPNGATVGACREGDPLCDDVPAMPNHPNVCNSPPHVMRSGTFQPGDMLITAVQRISVATGAGADGTFCTDDDITLGTPLTSPSIFSSGRVSVCIVDTNNVRNNPNLNNAKIGTGSKLPCTGLNTGCPAGESCYSPGGARPCPVGATDCQCRIACGTSFCLAEHIGAPVSSCEALRAGDTVGAAIGGGFGSLDFALGDAVVTFHLNPVPIPEPSMPGDLGFTSRGGQVVNASTGEPIAGAQVTFERHTIAFPTQGPFSGSTVTDADGRFDFVVFVHDTDRFTFTAEAGGFTPASHVFEGIELWFEVFEIDVALMPAPQ
jgi:hypothetical protein